MERMVGIDDYRFVCAGRQKEYNEKRSLYTKEIAKIRENLQIRNLIKQGERRASRNQLHIVKYNIIPTLPLYFQTYLQTSRVTPEGSWVHGVPVGSHMQAERSLFKRKVTNLTEGWTWSSEFYAKSHSRQEENSEKRRKDSLRKAKVRLSRELLMKPRSADTRNHESK